MYYWISQNLAKIPLGYCRELQKKKKESSEIAYYNVFISFSSIIYFSWTPKIYFVKLYVHFQLIVKQSSLLTDHTKSLSHQKYSASEFRSMDSQNLLTWHVLK